MSKDQKRLDLYAALMSEAKVRFDCLNFATKGKTQLPAPIVRELCYQQIRFLCELVCLSCLVAHGDVAELKGHKLGRAYSADDIIKRMGALRPHFYPLPIKEKIIGRVNEANVHREIEAVEPSPLDKAELLSIYGSTHKHLHRGSLSGIMASDTAWDLKLDVDDIVRTGQKFADLLSNHVIAINEQRIMLCNLVAANKGGRVAVAYAESPPPGIEPPPILAT